MYNGCDIFGGSIYNILFYDFFDLICILIYFYFHSIKFDKLAISPLSNAPPDSDALIIVEIHIIDSDTENDGEQIHVANIQFNNLDIIGKFKYF